VVPGPAPFATGGRKDSDCLAAIDGIGADDIVGAFGSALAIAGFVVMIGILGAVAEDGKPIAVSATIGEDGAVGGAMAAASGLKSLA
jgi:hypothetical protein